MKSLAALAFLIAIFSPGFAAELPREWTSADGRALKAALRRASSTTVTLDIVRGQTVDLPLARLSQADQDYVKQWLLDEPRRASHFTIEVAGTKSTDAQSFLKSNSAGGVRGGGRILESTNFKADYTVKPAPGEIVLEVRARLLPGKTSAGTQTLDFTKLRLRYLKDGKDEETTSVGPRWTPDEKTKMGDHKTLNVESGKPVDFGVGYLLSPSDKPLALEYKGAVEFQSPLR